MSTAAVGLSKHKQALFNRATSAQVWMERKSEVFFKDRASQAPKLSAFKDEALKLELEGLGGVRDATEITSWWCEKLTDWIMIILSDFHSMPTALFMYC